MFINKLKKVVGFVLALCIMGTLVLSVPVAVQAADDVFAPFTILDPDSDDDN